MDGVGGHARAFELLAVGTPQVEVRPAARLASEPARNHLVIVPRPTESVDDLLAHLPAAAAQRWADRDDQVLRTAAEVLLQRGDGQRGNPLHGAAPAGMNRRNDAEPPIADQDRRAVGHANDEGQRPIVADEAVGLWSQSVQAADDYRVAVDLVQQSETVGLYTGELGHAGPFGVAVAKL